MMYPGDSGFTCLDEEEKELIGEIEAKTSSKKWRSKPGA
jgi:hypothetical protein